MKVVILCGGKGTRIRGVDDDVPKPMIQIGNLPILFHIMRYYASWGHKEFILCLGYKSDVIKRFFLNYRAHISNFNIDFGRQGALTYFGGAEAIDWSVTMVETGYETLTGSRLKRVEQWIGSDEQFMLTYGDGLSDIDLSALVDFHDNHGRIMTVSGVRPPGRFGELDHDSSGRITEFNEKPQAVGGRISGGFFVCQRQIFDYLTDNCDEEMLELAPMRKLAQDGELMMYSHDGFWQCMDTYRDYMLLNELDASGTPPWERRNEAR